MGGFISRPTPAPAPAPQPKPKPKPKPVIQDIDPRDPSYSTKRRGRRSTILTSTTGVSQELELAKKTLLGG